MSKRDDGGQAFPRPMGSRIDGYGGDYSESKLGMSLRDYFAGQALAGLMANPEIQRHGKNAGMAEVAYGLDDAMLAERSKP